MTKEEIANIKRIDTSLNVFRKKIKTLDEKKHKLVDPIITEIMALEEEINFWEKPVIERYGKHTWELLKEAGEQTAEETSSEEEEETIPEEKAEVASELEKIQEPVTVVKPEPEPESPTEGKQKVDTEPVDDLPDTEWPEEWK